MADEAWEVVPGVGVGPLRFGAPREQLHAELGPYRAFRRGHSADLTDQYRRLGLMLTCGPGEGLYLIEMPDPSYVTFRGVTLDGSAQRVVEGLRRAGVAPEQDDSGWVFADGTVALYVPSSERDVVEAVTLFAPGHTVGEIVTIPGGATHPPTLSHVVRPGHGIGLVALGEARADVRRRLHEAMTHIAPPGSREPVEDLFWDDGLVVQYDDRERVNRILVVKADEVSYAGVNLMPGLTVPYDVVRQTLLAHGHPIVDRELGLELDGTGIQLWLGNTQTEWPLPVSAVVVSKLPY
ncbi:hypothetical protein KZZ52_23290 [Dactylosporangium sp. AC04546]|uniref:hypothetical protein n=1 Tax=Dactylosporangium sp. AC04546 TaxID=2862460 RepID=UPI002E7AE5E9|nr:hypothetical protein [Dactylosporangium sp. AC04546]WVK88202.1 hypothetical protein KZZ52_23290 [Dactylosporangium sp. AC04546]